MRCEAHDAPFGEPNKLLALIPRAQIRRSKWGKLFFATSYVAHTRFSL